MASTLDCTLMMVKSDDKLEILIFLAVVAHFPKWKSVIQIQRFTKYLIEGPRPAKLFFSFFPVLRQSLPAGERPIVASQLTTGGFGLSEFYPIEDNETCFM